MGTKTKGTGRGWWGPPKGTHGMDKVHKNVSMRPIDSVKAEILARIAKRDEKKKQEKIDSKITAIRQKRDNEHKELKQSYPTATSRDKAIIALTKKRKLLKDSSEIRKVSSKIKKLRALYYHERHI